MKFLHSFCPIFIDRYHKRSLPDKFMPCALLLTIIRMVTYISELLFKFPASRLCSAVYTCKIQCMLCLSRRFTHASAKGKVYVCTRNWICASSRKSGTHYYCGFTWCPFWLVF